MNKIMIGIPTLEYARRADFYDYINMIDKEGLEVGMTFAHGQSPARNRNIIIQTALVNGFTHVLFLDDDVVPRPDTLKRLLKHDVDIVTALYLMRNHPHFPVIFDESYGNGKCRYNFLRPNIKGLVKVKNCGLGCCLIKSSVFERMADDQPWIRLGQCEKDHWCDDIDFFNRARDSFGFDIFCDLDCTVGHMVSATIFPHRQEDGTWVTRGSFDMVNIFEIPQVVPSSDEISQYEEQEGLVTSGNLREN